jgi:hypothetical protein
MHPRGSSRRALGERVYNLGIPSGGAAPPLHDMAHDTTCTDPRSYPPTRTAAPTSTFTSTHAMPLHLHARTHTNPHTWHYMLPPPVRMRRRHLHAQGLLLRCLANFNALAVSIKRGSDRSVPRPGLRMILSYLRVARGSSKAKGPSLKPSSSLIS